MPIEILANPGFAGQKPRILKPQCHDRTPFLSYACLCGVRSHMHESQITELPDAVTIWFSCSSCGDGEPIHVELVRAAFTQMREEGWIA